MTSGERTKKTAVVGHPNHQPDTSRPLDPTEGACTCGLVQTLEQDAAHRARCADFYARQQAKRAGRLS